MLIVAGPPGSGKSEAFKVGRFGVDFFNADDLAAELNGGSYHDIPLHVRKLVSQELEKFIESHISAGESFAFETTLRTPITFEQAGRARSKGFVVNMVYVALDDVQMNLDRIVARAKLGFHSAPESLLRDIHRSSLENFRRAVRECGVSIDELSVFDNTPFDCPPRLIAKIVGNDVAYMAKKIPQWLADALPGGRIPGR